MEHSVHVSAGHFIEGVGPTSASKVMKKVKEMLGKAHAGDDDLDQLDSELDAVFKGGAEDGEDEEEDEEECFDVGDTVGKALALIQQVSVPIGHGSVTLESSFFADPKITPSTCIFQADMH